MKAKEIDMVNGPLNAGIIRFTVPLMITNLLSLVFNATDLIVVGQFCGSKAVAAVGATSTLVALMVNFFAGLSSGASVVVAQYLGGKDDKAVERAVHTIMPIAVLAAIIITAIGVPFSKTFLGWMNTPSDVINGSALYLKIYFGGVIFRLIYMFSSAILRAGGDTKSPMKYLTLGGILNVGFNIMFITLFGMDVDGVAWGTLISEMVSAVLCVWKLTRRNDALKLNIKKLCIDTKIIQRIAAIGIPAGVQSSLFAISNVLIQSSINSFGTDVLAGNSAASSIANFVSTAALAFQHTGANFMGQNIGARNYERARKLPFAIIKWGVLFSVVAGALVFVFARPLLGIYIKDNPAAIEYGIKRILVVTLFYFTCNVMEDYTGILRGMGKSFIPMIISLVGCCGLRILWIYTVVQIPKYHSISVLYASYPISWTITSICLIISFRKAWKNIVATHQLKKSRNKETYN